VSRPRESKPRGQDGPARTVSCHPLKRRQKGIAPARGSLCSQRSEADADFQPLRAIRPCRRSLDYFLQLECQTGTKRLVPAGEPRDLSGGEMFRPSPVCTFPGPGVRRTLSYNRKSRVQGGLRSRGLLVFSQALYRLSYPHFNSRACWNRTNCFLLIREACEPVHQRSASRRRVLRVSRNVSHAIHFSRLASTHRGSRQPARFSLLPRANVSAGRRFYS
jgi:hypothetical protein